MIETKIQEDGFPGGIGVGLELPGGYINGAPTGSNEQTIKELVLNNISDEDFDNFVSEYFESLIKDFKQLNEDENGDSPFPFTGTDVLDNPSFAGSFNAGWEEFDEYDYVSQLPGWNVQGHLSDSYPESVTSLKSPNVNHSEENGEGKRTIHPSKGEEYAKDKAEKWEVSPHLTLDKTYRPDAAYEEFYEGKIFKNNLIKESVVSNQNENKKILNNFVKYCVEKLKLKEEPTIQYMDGEYAKQQRALGGYNPETKTIIVVTQDRIMADVMRTLAHELVHRKQDELGLIGDVVINGATGSPTENVANSVAAIIMRNYGKIDDTIYITKLNEDYIPGGKAKGKSLKDIADKHNTTLEDIKKELHKGIKVEMEHTSDVKIAAEIARDHIWENLHYYEKLDKAHLEEGLLLEGGAAGHLAHPFEDESLRFSDMKEMIKRGLVGGLDKEAPVSEKLDGQNIAFSVKNGNIVFGRNKGHVRNGGENALDVQGIAKQFAGRGGIEKAFTGAAEDLHAAITKLKPEQVKKMFGNGSKFMSLEIILPDTTNVIPYGKSVLVMHGTIEYNKDGEQIGRSTEDADEFAKAVQRVGADKQKTFGIEGPKTIAFSDTDSKQYTQKAKEYINQLSSLEKQYGLDDTSKLEDYRREWWHNEVYKQEKENGLKFTTQQALGLIRRFADGDKSFGKKDFKNPKAQEWFKNFEENELQAAQKKMIKPIESVFLNAGAQTLKRVTNFLGANNPGAADALRKETIQSIKGIKDSKDVDKIAKLQIELERLNNIGMDNVVPSEGIVFQYGGKPYKFTGAFAPINQINGTFKFDKPKKKEETPIAKEQPKENNKDTIAVFSGRFQPFHAGHYSIYKALVDKFGKDNVYIASSNAQDPIKSPFPFRDKKNIMTKMFGIPTKNVVQVKNPYAPVEILDRFPPETKYVTAVSQKDAERLEKGGKYFHNFDKVPSQKRKGYGDAGYFIVAPEMKLKVNGKNISGTQLRATFGSNKLSIPEKKRIFQQVYPTFDKDTFANIVATTKRAEVAKNGKTTKVKPQTKPKQIKVDPKNNKKLQKVLQTKIKNPVTGNTILVKSALKYDNKQAVKKMAMSLVKQALSGGKVKTNNIFE
jgi:hypothetical protein